MRLSAMGDVAMTVPVLRAFTSQYPEVKVTLISRPFFEPFFEEIPNVSFFAFDAKGKHKGFLGLLRLFKELKPWHIDAFADLHNVLRSKVIKRLFAFSGKPVAAVNKGRAEKKALLRAENKIFKPLPTMFERHAQVFAALGFPLDLSQPKFPSAKALDQKTLEITGNKTQKWIGIAPFAQYESKVYPQDLMQKVIDELSKSDAKIFLLGGGKREIEILDTFAKGKPNVVVIAGKLHFREELQLLSNLDIMLSMDSGNAHIAAMLGVKTITLWGATHPFAGFSPFNQPIENALVSDREKYPKIPTSVYGNKTVEGYRDAMRTILPETVVAKIAAILK